MSDDLISRQAAIYIIQQLYPGIPRVKLLQKKWQKRYEPYIRVENAIRELPSAQPYVDCQKCVFCGFAGFKQFQTGQSDVSDTNVGDMISRQPTIDAVEVVRCGKCNLRYKPLDDDARNEIYCELIGSTMRKDDFCSYGCADGERKDDADNR